MTGSVSFLRQALLATVFAAALDLSLSSLNGYQLHEETAARIGLDCLLLGAVVFPVVGLFHLARAWPGVGTLCARAPGFITLAAAWAPIALVRLWRDHDAAAVLIQLVVGAVLLALAWIELHRRRRPSAWRGEGVAAALAVLAVGLAMSPRLPGRSMLQEPRPVGGPPATPSAPNLLFIVLDTLRADHLGLYGYPRATSPWLDNLAAGATVFEEAVAPSSYTLPVHATLFTGLYPRSHGADIHPDGVSLEELARLNDTVAVAPLAPQAVTLAEIAWGAGLETGAICANSAYLYRAFGLDQGFDTYVDAPGTRAHWRPAGLSLGAKLPLGRQWWYYRRVQGLERYYLQAPQVNALAIEWLRPRRQRRFFLFLNYMDPHAPNQPAGPYRNLFPSAGDPQILDRERFAVMSGRAQADPGRLAATIDAYDAEVRYLDDHLAQLFSRLEAWNLLDRTLVVIVGDHGESLGEHSRLGHAVSLYQSELRVPLIVRTPGQAAGRRVATRVHLVDLMPTLVEQMGFQRPPQLQSAGLLVPGRPFPMVAYLGPYERAWSEEAIYRGPWKLIRRSRGQVELYNLELDPGERTNRGADHPDLVAELTRSLEQFAAEVEPHFPQASPVGDPAARERLRALGYLD